MATNVSASAVLSDGEAAAVADAATAGDAAEVRALVKHGANPSAVGDQGVSVLEWAMLNKSKAGFEALLASGADVRHADRAGDSVMLYAAKANDPAYLSMLLAHGADPNVRNTVTGTTSLMAALLGDRDAQFHMLLRAGADANLRNRSGDTALHVAAEINAFGHVLELLEAGADPTARNGQGVTIARYLSMTQATLLSADARRQQDDVRRWLRDHHVPHERDYDLPLQSGRAPPR